MKSLGSPYIREGTPDDPGYYLQDKNYGNYSDPKGSPGRRMGSPKGCSNRPCKGLVRS